MDKSPRAVLGVRASLVAQVFAVLKVRISYYRSSLQAMSSPRIQLRAGPFAASEKDMTMVSNAMLWWWAC